MEQNQTPTKERAIELFKKHQEAFIAKAIEVLGEVHAQVNLLMYDPQNKEYGQAVISLGNFQEEDKDLIANKILPDTITQLVVLRGFELIASAFVSEAYTAQVTAKDSEEAQSIIANIIVQGGVKSVPDRQEVIIIQYETPESITAVTYKKVGRKVELVEAEKPINEARFKIFNKEGGYSSPYTA